MIFDVKCSSSVVLPVSATVFDELIAAVIAGLDGIRTLDVGAMFFTLDGYSYLSEVGVFCQNTFEGVCALVGSEGRISLTLHASDDTSPFLFDACAPVVMERPLSPIKMEEVTRSASITPRPLNPSHVSEVVHRAHTLLSSSPAHPDRLSPTRTRVKAVPDQHRVDASPTSTITSEEPQVRVRFPEEDKFATVAIPEKLRDMWRRVAEATQYIYTRGSHRMAAVRDGDGMEVDIDDDDDLAMVVALITSGSGDVYIQLVDACREGARLQKKKTVIRTVISPLRNISNVSMSTQ